MGLSDLAVKLTRPLKKEELKRLDGYFTSLGASNGVLHTAATHGAITANVCGPSLVLPSEWMPLVMCNTGEFQSLKQERDIVRLVMRMYKRTSITLRSGKRFEPLFVTRAKTTSGALESDPQVDAWCRGFIKGMALRGVLWRQHDQSNLRELLLPILALGARHEDIADEARTVLGNAILRRELACWIPDAVAAIYAFWRENPPRYERGHLASQEYDPGLYINTTIAKRTPQTKVFH